MKGTSCQGESNVEKNPQSKRTSSASLNTMRENTLPSVASLAVVIICSINLRRRTCAADT